MESSTPRSVSAIQRAIKEEKTASDATLSTRVSMTAISRLAQGFKKMAYPNRDSFVKMKITLDVFEAYLKCSTKCWLRATNEPSAGGIYPEWVKAQNDSYRVSETQRLVTEFPNNEVALSPDMTNLKAAKWRLASSLAVQVQMDSCALQSELHALERVPAKSRAKPTQFIPIRFVFTNKLSKDDKLLLALPSPSRNCWDVKSVSAELSTATSTPR